MRKLRILCSSLCALILLGLPHVVGAAGQVTVSPGQLSFQLSAQNAVDAQTLTVTNNFDSAVTIETSLAGIDQTNGLFYPTEDIDEIVARQIAISPTTLQIEPKQTAAVTVTVTNSPDLSPGGHYATLLLRQNSDTPANNLGIDSAISINLFIEKFGGGNKSILLENAKFPHTPFTFPSSATLTFVNNGNMLVVPRAAIRLTQTNNAENRIGYGIGNSSSQPLLPGKTLQTETQLRISGRMWLPGKYTATVQYRADGIDGSETLTQSFWYFPPYLLIIPAFAYLSYRFLHKQYRKTHRKSVKKAPKTVRRQIAQPTPPKTDGEDNSIHVRVIKKVKVRIDEENTEES